MAGFGRVSSQDGSATCGSSGVAIASMAGAWSVTCYDPGEATGTLDSEADPAVELVSCFGSSSVAAVSAGRSARAGSRRRRLASRRSTVLTSRRPRRRVLAPASRPPAAQGGDRAARSPPSVRPRLRGGASGATVVTNPPSRPPKRRGGDLVREPADRRRGQLRSTVRARPRFDLEALFAASAIAVDPGLRRRPARRRAVPALLYRAQLDCRRVIAAGLLQATSLPFIVAATAIGQDLGLIDAATSAGFIAAGLLTVLAPARALGLLRRSERLATPPARRRQLGSRPPTNWTRPERRRWMPVKPRSLERGDDLVALEDPHPARPLEHRLQRPHRSSRRTEVMSAIRPPGASTRRISSRAANGSANRCRAAKQQAASKLASRNGSRSRRRGSGRGCRGPRGAAPAPPRSSIVARRVDADDEPLGRRPRARTRGRSCPARRRRRAPCRPRRGRAAAARSASPRPFPGPVRPLTTRPSAGRQ